NPRDTKASLARAIVARYHGEKVAKDVEDRWNNQFREGNKPKDIDEIKIKPGKVLDIVSMHFELSKSEVRRLVSQGGIKIDDEVVKDVDQKISKSALVQVGKRRFVKFKI
ncbi:MAG TPA: S4 domain-containing protein, partial [Candidatus Saccharibacteria bacterium]|nr:S4 domain-containing protein [Candidatus Saccharibacteria bacterium]